MSFGRCRSTASCCSSTSREPLTSREPRAGGPAPVRRSGPPRRLCGLRRFSGVAGAAQRRSRHFSFLTNNGNCGAGFAARRQASRGPNRASIAPPGSSPCPSCSPRCSRDVRSRSLGRANRPLSCPLFAPSEKSPASRRTALLPTWLVAPKEESPVRVAVAEGPVRCPWRISQASQRCKQQAPCRRTSVALAAADLDHGPRPPAGPAGTESAVVARRSMPATCLRTAVACAVVTGPTRACDLDWSREDISADATSRVGRRGDHRDRRRGLFEHLLWGDLVRAKRLGADVNRLSVGDGLQLGRRVRGGFGRCVRRR